MKVFQIAHSVGHINITSHLFHQYQSNQDVFQTMHPVHNINTIINTITNISEHFRSAPKSTPYSIYTVGHINTIANILPLSVHWGCIQIYTAYIPAIDQRNTVINVSVHCGSVPNHIACLIYAVNYMNTIIDITVHLDWCPKSPKSWQFLVSGHLCSVVSTRGVLS